jgi:hypothetical protein
VGVIIKKFLSTAKAGFSFASFCCSFAFTAETLPLVQFQTMIGPNRSLTHAYTNLRLPVAYELKSTTSLPATLPLFSFAIASGIFAMGKTSYMGLSLPLKMLEVLHGHTLSNIPEPQTPKLSSYRTVSRLLCQ